AALSGCPLGERALGWSRVEHQWLTSALLERLLRIVVVEGEVAGLHGVALVGHHRAHLDAVRDAGAVGDDEAGSGPGSGCTQYVDGLLGAGAHRDLGDVHIAVGHGYLAEILLADGLAAGRELGNGAARRGLRSLPAGIAVDLGVEDEDVDVPAGGEHVIEPTEADVVSPAVAAHHPQLPVDERFGYRAQAGAVHAL